MSVDLPRPVCPTFFGCHARLHFARRPRRTNDDDIELKTTFQELVLNLLGDGVETDVGGSADFLDCNSGHV